MSDIPDGVDYNTALVAIAWEMVKSSIHAKTIFAKASPEERIKIMLALYAKAILGVENPTEVEQAEE